MVHTFNLSNEEAEVGLHSEFRTPWATQRGGEGQGGRGAGSG